MPFFHPLEGGRPCGGRRRVSPVRVLPALATLVLGAPVLAGPPEPSGALPAGAGDLRPSAALPEAPRALPEALPFPAFTWSREWTTARPLAGDTGLFRPSSIAPRLAPGFEAGGLGGRLLSRMKREAQRYHRENVSIPLIAPGAGPFDDLDTLALAQRSDEAARIVTRAVHRTLDQELERLARRSLGLGSTLDLFGRMSSRGGRQDAPAPSATPGAGAVESRQDADRPGRVTGGVGLRLDAHPALVLKTTFFGVQGRLDLPARDEPLRLSIEGPAGPRGRAVLTSGLPRDGRGWATLTFNFRF